MLSKGNVSEESDSDSIGEMHFERVVVKSGLLRSVLTEDPLDLVQYHYTVE